MAGGIDFLESIPGLPKHLQIRALNFFFMKTLRREILVFGEVIEIFLINMVMETKNLSIKKSYIYRWL
jgi:hypothetical protein